MPTMGSLRVSTCPESLGVRRSQPRDGCLLRAALTSCICIDCYVESSAADVAMAIKASLDRTVDGGCPTGGWGARALVDTGRACEHCFV